MNKKGFTLVELLAVIAILAILVIMALPAVLRMFNQARKDSFTNEVNTLIRTARQQYLLSGGEAQVWSNATGSSNTLNLSGSKDLKYIVKMDGSGKVTKLQATNGSFQYNKSGIIDVADKDDIKAISELSSGSILDIDSALADILDPNSSSNVSRFEYVVNNNEVTITGYKGILCSYEVYNVTSCTNTLKEYIKSTYDLEEEAAVYSATELCNYRSVDNSSLTDLFHEYSIPLGRSDDYEYGLSGISVYKVDDLIDKIDKNQCVTGGTQLLMSAYSLDQSTAQAGATELCNGGRFEGVTLQEAIESKMITYEYYSTLGISLIFLNNAGDVIVPSTINGLPVTTIGQRAFEHSWASFVELPNSIKVLEPYAFYHAYFPAITLPNSLEIIGDSAFDMASIEGIIIPDSVTTIGSSAFIDSGLMSVTIGNGVQTIGDFAFYLNRITNITIPSSVMSIGKAAFSTGHLRGVTIKGKNSSSEFTNWGADDVSPFGNVWMDSAWASDVTCVKDNTSNVTNGCITWGA